MAKDEIGDLVVERDGRSSARSRSPRSSCRASTRPRPAAGRRPPRLGGDLPGRPRLGGRPRADGGVVRLGARARPRDDGHRLARHEPALVALLAGARLPDDLPAPLPAHSRSAARIPILSGSRVAVVNVPEDAVVLRPRPPSEAIATSARPSATRSASRSRARRSRRSSRAGGKATIVVEPPELPLPGAPNDPRQAALAAAIARARAARRPVAPADDPRRGRAEPARGQRELEALVAPPSARRFHGRVEVHDAEAPDLVHARRRRRGRRCGSTGSLAETDLVVCVTAAETVLHGGPGALLGACGAETLRAATAYSLLETAAAARLAARPRARARARGARARDRRLARAQPAAAAGPLPRLPLRGRVARAPRDLAAAPVLAPPLRGPPPHPPGPRARAHRGRRLRGAAVGRARRGAPARDRPALDPARATARRDRDRDAVEAPPLPARAAEPAHGRDRRARPGAAALAGRLPRRRGRHRDRAPPALAPLPARHAGSVPLALPRAPRRPHRVGARRRGAGGGDGRARRSPPTGPAAPATRCCRTPTGRAARPRSTGSAPS